MESDGRAAVSLESTSLLAVLGGPAVLADGDDVVIALSPAAMRDASMGTALGRRLWDVELGAELEELRDAVETVRRGNAPVRIPVPGATDENSELVVAAIPERPGKTAVLISLDIDDRDRHRYIKALEERCAQLSADLEVRKDAELRKDEFLAMLAHELRNPLAAALNALYIVRQRTSADRVVSRVLRVAERQLLHQARLLGDLLDTSRLVLGKIELRQEMLDLRDGARHVVDAASLSLQTKAHEFSFDVPADPLPVRGDPARLEQAMSNLLANAVKYTPPGGKVAVRLEHAAGRRGIFQVIDSGVGIEPSKLSWIFQLFTQGDSSIARTQGGLGVGLWLARTLVEMHGGQVTAASAGRDQGATFEIDLPLVRADATSTLARSDSAPRPGIRHILVVEDNADARELLRIVLEMEGYQVSEAPDGHTAIHLASANAPDVVLLDVGLPDLDGYEVARRIRKRLGNAVRLIAVTGYSDSEARTLTQGAGFDLHIVKPVSPEDLARALTAA